MNLKGLRLPFDSQTAMLSVLKDETGNQVWASFAITDEAALTEVLTWLTSGNDQMYVMAKTINLLYHGLPAIQFTISQLDPLMEKDGRNCWMVTETDRQGGFVSRQRLQTAEQIWACVVDCWCQQQEHN
ncbi:hypothetical protein [Spirosoma aerolatum]|uniref:hypothetical protein n=1 Tax=Spirosoma aerolatum TaxID=1211326 RepID=UPI0009ABC15F|nr:hypothetical protein [Spirosoma aerolatum]